MKTYTVLEMGKTTCKYQGFERALHTPGHGHEILAVVWLDGQPDFWSLDYCVVDTCGSKTPVKHPTEQSLAELRRYYKEIYDVNNPTIHIYEFRYTTQKT